MILQFIGSCMLSSYCYSDGDTEQWVWDHRRRREKLPMSSLPQEMRGEFRWRTCYLV